MMHRKKMEFHLLFTVEVTCHLFYSSIDANITVDTGSCNETGPGVYSNRGSARDVKNWRHWNCLFIWA